MTKTIIAIGKTTNGQTTVYAPVQRNAGEAIVHAVSLWSALVLAVGKLENAKQHMEPLAQIEIDRLINDFVNTLASFEVYWIGEIEDERKTQHASDRP